MVWEFTGQVAPSIKKQSGSLNFYLLCTSKRLFFVPVHSHMHWPNPWILCELYLLEPTKVEKTQSRIEWMLESHLVTTYIRSLIYYYYFLMFIFERQREHMCTRASRGKAERKEDRTPSKFCTAVSAEPDAGLKLTNCEIMSWVEIKSRTFNWLSHPRRPGALF